MILTNIYEAYSGNVENCDAIIPKTDNIMEACMQVAYESTINYNNIMKAVGIEETVYFAQTGKDLFTEASASGGFFKKLKEFFLKIWAKIKGIFTKFIALFDSWTKSDSEFLNKYRKKLLAGGKDLSDMKYKGFKFTLDKISINTCVTNMKTYKLHDKITLDASQDGVAGIVTLLNGINTTTDENGFKNIVDKINDKMEDLGDELRGYALDGNGTYDQSEFTKELFSRLRNGEDTKEELDNIDIADYLSILSNSKTLKKEMKSDYDKNKKTFDDLAKWCDKCSDGIAKVYNKAAADVDATYKDFAKADKSSDDNKKGAYAMQIAAKMATGYRTMSSILTTINGARLTAIKDCSRQAKAICVKALTYTPKYESYEFDDDQYSSNLLENVKMI